MSETPKDDATVKAAKHMAGECDEDCELCHAGLPRGMMPMPRILIPHPRRTFTLEED